LTRLGGQPAPRRCAVACRPWCTARRPRAAQSESHSGTQHNTTQHNTTQHNTTQHNTTQHNTTQHNTTQHNTTQHNTTQHQTQVGWVLRVRAMTRQCGRDHSPTLSSMTRSSLGSCDRHSRDGMSMSSSTAMSCSLRSSHGVRRIGRHVCVDRIRNRTQGRQRRSRVRTQLRSRPRAYTQHTSMLMGAVDVALWDSDAYTSCALKNRRNARWSASSSVLCRPSCTPPNRDNKDVDIAAETQGWRSIGTGREEQVRDSVDDGVTSTPQRRQLQHQLTTGSPSTALHRIRLLQQHQRTHSAPTTRRQPQSRADCALVQGGLHPPSRRCKRHSKQRRAESPKTVAPVIQYASRRSTDTRARGRKSAIGAASQRNARTP
jgi:hypothetical protein